MWKTARTKLKRKIKTTRKSSKRIAGTVVKSITKQRTVAERKPMRLRLRKQECHAMSTECVTTARRLDIWQQNVQIKMKKPDSPQCFVSK